MCCRINKKPWVRSSISLPWRPRHDIIKPSARPGPAHMWPDSTNRGTYTQIVNGIYKLMMGPVWWFPLSRFIVVWSMDKNVSCGRDGMLLLLLRRVTCMLTRLLRMRRRFAGRLCGRLCVWLIRTHKCMRHEQTNVLSVCEVWWVLWMSTVCRAGMAFLTLPNIKRTS